jgi:hypothetical protein
MIHAGMDDADADVEVARSDLAVSQADLTAVSPLDRTV